MTTFGKITLRKEHVLCSSTVKFAITQHLQILLCFLGQSKVFDEASLICKKLLNLDISSPQIQRVCRFYGELIDPLVEKNIEEYIPKLSEVNEKDKVYVMIDGSYLPTRNKEWKEIKLGRIFNDRKIIPIHTNRNEIMESVYVSHMGSVHDFFPKLERHLVPYRNKVIIADGASWIWNWAEDNYPGAIQILDFYHAKEKLVLFAKHQFKEEEKRRMWVEQKCELLMQNKVEEVISTVKSLRSSGEKAKEVKQKLISYYIEHEDRMMYQTYREKGLLIGSGPIEAAHRSVLQQRMKLSGQKWSIEGANAIANLRCYQKSGAWDMIENIIKAA